MQRLPILLIVSFISFNCTHIKMLKEAQHNFDSRLANPEEAEAYPELTERNKLMGNLSSERTCYNVSHYDLNLDIDVEAKTIVGHNTITALAVHDFSTLQIDLQDKMNIEKIEHNGNELNYSRKEDAVFVEFPKMTQGTEFSFTIHYNGTPRVAPRPPWIRLTAILLL